jgi:Ni,Fe-hydrogenase I cytochrome b subunit
MNRWRSPLVLLGARHGLIGGVLGFVLLIGLFYLGRHPFLIPLIFDFRLILFGFFIYYTLREIREDYQQGVLFLWQGMISSFVFTIAYVGMASLLLGLFMWLNDTFVQEYIRLKVMEIKSFPEEIVKQLGKDTIDSNLKRLPATNRLDLISIYVRQSLIISFFVSFILSVVLRRQPTY